MDLTCVMMDLTAGSALGPNGRPLMLQDVLFYPALHWCASAWMDRGVRQFFVACDDAYVQEVRDALPQGAEAHVGTLASCRSAVAHLPADAHIIEVRRPVLPVGSTFRLFKDLRDLGELQESLRASIVDKHRAEGVSILDIFSVYIGPQVTIGAGTRLLPGTILRGSCSIGKNCEIGPNAMVTDCTVGDGCVINASQAEESTLAQNVHVGPYAHIRPKCQIGDGVKVGAYVEVKNAVFGEGTKMSHLTYVGDADVGCRVNFGCGTITSNYDGFKKHRTTIGDDVFVGCNTNLVPPVSVGDGAYIAAGTTVTKDVAPDSLAIGRVRQEVKAGWAKKRRSMNKSNK